MPLLDLDVQRRLLDCGDKPTLRALAANPSLDADLQVEIASSGEVWSRIVLASNPSLDPAAESVLLGTTIQQVHRRLAANPVLRSSSQVALAQSRDMCLRILLLSRPDLSVEAQAVLAETACPWTIPHFFAFLSASSVHLPVFIYQAALGGSDLMEEACRAAGASRETFWALATNWRGSLATLLEATFLVETSAA